MGLRPRSFMPARHFAAHGRSTLSLPDLRGPAIVLLLTAGVIFQGLDATRFSGLPRDPLGDAPVTLQEAASSGRHSLFIALRTEAPAARIVLDTTAAEAVELSAQYLRALGGASEVVVRTLGPAPNIDGLVTLEGTSRQGHWAIALDPVSREARPILLVFAGSDGPVVVEARMFPGLESVADTALTGARTRGTMFSIGKPTQNITRTIIVDAALLLSFLLLGSLLLPRNGLDPWLRAPLSLLAGVSLQVALGILLLPHLFGFVAAVTTAFVLAAVLRHSGVVTGTTRSDAAPFITFGALLVIVALTVRVAGFVKVSPDSFDYWTDAQALAEGTLGFTDLSLKRPPGLAAVHAVGFVFGSEGVLSVGAAVLLAGAAVVVLLPRTFGSDVRRWQYLAALALGLLALTSAQLVVMAAYLNTHMIVSGVLLLIAVLWFVQDRAGRGVVPVSVLLSISLVALVMLRAEAVLLIGLILVGGLTARKVAQVRSASGMSSSHRPPWNLLWSAGGAALAAWGAVIVTAEGSSGARVSAPALAILTAGLTALLATPLLHRIPEYLRHRAPMAVAAALWALTAALLVTELGSSVTFFSAARVNLGEGAGGWGLTAPLLVVLAVGGALSARGAGAAVARWTVIGFFPATLLAMLAAGTERLDASADNLGGQLLSGLLSGGGRIGWGDSANRMWTHVALVVLLLALLSLLEYRGRPATSHRREPAPRRRPALGSVVILLLVVALTLSEVSRWNVVDLGPAGPPAIASLDVAGHGWPEGSGEFVPFPHGTVRSESLGVPSGFVLPDDVRSAEVCVAVVLANPAGADGGRVVTTLTASSAGEIVAATRTDLATSTDAPTRKILCLPLPLPAVPTAPLTVTWSGEGTPGAPSMGVVLASDGSLVEDATVSFYARSVDPRPLPARALSVAVRRSLDSGAIVITGSLLVLLALSALRRERT